MNVSPNRNLRLRPYCVADAVPLLALFKDTVRRVNSQDYNPDQVAAWASDEIDIAHWTARFQNRFVVVAESWNDFAGFGELEPDGHIDRFYVSADFQRCGVGRMLLQAIMAEAARQGIPRLFAEVSITARPFFERHEFVVVAPQTVLSRGQSFVNFRMERPLHGAIVAEKSTSSEAAGGLVPQ